MNLEIEHEVSEEEAYEYYCDGNEPQRAVIETEDTVDNKGRLINQQPMYDKLLNAEVALQLGDKRVIGKVAQCVVDSSGQAIGAYDDKPFLNTLSYEVEFPDGQVKE